MLKSTLQAYKEDLEKGLHLLNTVKESSENDWSFIREEAHRLSGSSAVLGFEGVSSAFKILEFAIQKGVASDEHLKVLVINTMGSVKSALSEVLEKLSANDFEEEGVEQPNEVDIPDVQIKKVLVVDDDRLIRTLLLTKLRAHGFEVLEAVDGQEGVDVALSQCPDLILMDGKMPEMDGFEAIRILRTSEDSCVAETPIFMLTGLDDDESRGEGVELGVNAYITKPFTIDTILDEIKKLK